MANLAGSLFWEEKITTTVTRAKSVRPVAEKLITKARKGDLHSRREVLKVIEDAEIVTKLFDDIAPRYAERPGGYTRIVRVGPRRGDNAEMAIIELV
jgi:large subunit ribosomal protein L17